MLKPAQNKPKKGQAFAEMRRLLALAVLGAVRTASLSSTPSAPRCPAGSVAVGDGGAMACVATATARVTLDGVTFASESLAGCAAVGTPKVLHSSAALVRLERTLTCAASKYHTTPLSVAVTDTFSAVGSPSPAIEWNTTLSSTAPRYWTTEVNDAITVPLGGNASVWAAATTGSRLEADSSSLTATPLSEFTGRTYYGRDQWSSNGKGTVMLCSGYGGASCHAHRADAPVDIPADESAWFIAPNAIPCSYPRCCEGGACKPGHPSAYALVVLGNASSHPAVSTGADCQKLCEAHPDCDVWQLGSAHRGRTCEWAQGMKNWNPMMDPSGDKVAGCKKAAGVTGCGHNPPMPPPAPPAPAPPRETIRTTALPLISLLFPGTKRGVSTQAIYTTVACDLWFYSDRLLVMIGLAHPGPLKPPQQRLHRCRRQRLPGLDAAVVPAWQRHRPCPAPSIHCVARRRLAPGRWVSRCVSEGSFRGPRIYQPQRHRRRRVVCGLPRGG